MNHAPCEHGFGFCCISDHVWSVGMCFQRVGARPLLYDDERVGAERRLKTTETFDVDGSPIFDTARFGADRRNIRPELGEEFIALSRMGRNECKNMQHKYFSLRR